jgi:hypothetical protein
LLLLLLLLLLRETRKAHAWVKKVLSNRPCFNYHAYAVCTPYFSHRDLQGADPGPQTL